MKKITKKQIRSVLNDITITPLMQDVFNMADKRYLLTRVGEILREIKDMEQYPKEIIDDKLKQAMTLLALARLHGSN